MHRPKPPVLPKTPEENFSIPSSHGPDPAFGIVTQGQYRSRCAKCGSEYCDCYDRGDDGPY